MSDRRCGAASSTSKQQKGPQVPILELEAASRMSGLRSSSCWHCLVGRAGCKHCGAQNQRHGFDSGLSGPASLPSPVEPVLDLLRCQAGLAAHRILGFTRRVTSLRNQGRNLSAGSRHLASLGASGLTSAYSFSSNSSSFLVFFRDIFDFVPFGRRAGPARAAKSEGVIMFAEDPAERYCRVACIASRRTEKSVCLVEQALPPAYSSASCIWKISQHSVLPESASQRVNPPPLGSCSSRCSCCCPCLWGNANA